MNNVNECVICRQEKETVLAVVKAYHEHGQPTPILKIEVCESCLSTKKAEPGFKRGMDL